MSSSSSSSSYWILNLSLKFQFCLKLLLLLFRVCIVEEVPLSSALIITQEVAVGAWVTTTFLTVSVYLSLSNQQLQALHAMNPAN